MFAQALGSKQSVSRDETSSLLSILGDLFNRGETLNFTEKSGAFETNEEVRKVAKVIPNRRSSQLSVARPGHEVYTRRARTGYIHTTALGSRVNTRG